MHLKFITDNWQMHNFQPVINFLTKFKLINRHSVTIRNLPVETCDRKDIPVMTFFHYNKIYTVRNDFI